MSDCPDDPDIVAPPIHDHGDDRMNLLGKCGAGLAAAHPGVDGDEGDSGPALEHFDAPDRARVEKCVVQGAVDRVRQVREHHNAKMVDLGR